MRLTLLVIFIISTFHIAHAGMKGKPVIVDGDTIIIDNNAIRLEGIDAPEAGQKCNKASRRKWSCGKEAVKVITNIIDGKTVRFKSVGTDDFNRTIATCYVGDTNINATMVRLGYAWAFRKYSTNYIEDEEFAKKQNKGIWQAKTETAWDYRAQRWKVAVQVAPKGCPIKGNISSNGRIYHTPWSPWYKRTRINLKNGERWFCSEFEAIKAGWRAPHWG